MKKLGNLFKNPFSKSSKSSSKSRKSSMAPSISATSYGSVNFSNGNYNINNSDLGKIHLAVCEQNINKVKKCIGNINELDKLKRTALHFAAAFGNVEILQFLLISDASLNLPDHDLKTPLMKAIECHHGKCAQLIIEKGLSKKMKFDAVDNDGNSILHFICRENLIELIPLFFNERTRYLADKQNKQGQTPLHLAVERNCGEIIDQLLEEEINVNLQDSIGMTPLMLACIGNNVEVVETLVNYDADLTIKNKDGMTAENIASNRDYKECLNEILNATKQQNDDVMNPPDYYDDNDDGEVKGVTNNEEKDDHEMGYIQAKKITNQLSMTQSIDDMEDTVNEIETFRSHIDNHIEELSEDEKSVALEPSNKNNLESLNNTLKSKPSTLNAPFVKTFTNETKAFGFTYKPDPLHSEKSDWDDSISECSVHDAIKMNPPISKPSKIHNTSADINPPEILKKSIENLFDSKKEKSTDCDSALIPLLCVHG